jgi:hypothetical protein
MSTVAEDDGAAGFEACFGAGFDDVLEDDDADPQPATARAATRASAGAKRVITRLFAAPAEADHSYFT